MELFEDVSGALVDVTRKMKNKNNNNNNNMGGPRVEKFWVVYNVVYGMVRLVYAIVGLVVLVKVLMYFS